MQSEIKLLNSNQVKINIEGGTVSVWLDPHGKSVKIITDSNQDTVIKPETGNSFVVRFMGRPEKRG